MILTVKQLSERLGKSEKAIQTMCQRGQLPHSKLGRKIIFLEEDLERFFRSLPSLPPHTAIVNLKNLGQPLDSSGYGKYIE